MSVQKQPVDVDTLAAGALSEAMQLIADSRRWTTGAPAKRADGCPVEASASTAVRWCFSGALTRCVEALDLEIPLRSSVYMRALPPGTVHINDHLGHKAVLRLASERLASLCAGCDAGGVP